MHPGSVVSLASRLPEFADGRTGNNLSVPTWLESEPNLTEISFQIQIQLKPDVSKETEKGCEKKKKSGALPWELVELSRYL